MNDKKQYTSHLCTFMGREANLEILLPYIEGALLNNAVDNYWFIDMTRKRSDHELIKKESSRLNDMFPGRVHLYNSEERSKIIDDKDKIAEVSGDWSVFYKFLLKFNDNDIIAKCDDDTYFIDISTLKAAFDLRWKNKKPYLMHANAINNGVCAYHQNKKGIWSDKETKMYPLGGLSGPLFAHPEVACAHHKKFTQDLCNNFKNLEKYKLKKNIQFCNRVSINFIFMLGRDRKELSKITSQDEYDTSCKYAAAKNRPNLLIGDFIMAHHTYGNQEPTMEKLKTDIGYKKLLNKINPATTKVEHKDITDNVNATSTISSKKGKLLFKSWVENNSYALKDPNTGLFLSLTDVVDEGKSHPLNQKKKLSRTNNIKEACVFNINVNDVSPIYLNNATTILNTPLDNDKDQLLIFPIPAIMAQAHYKVSQICVEKTKGNLCKIRSHKFKNFQMCPNEVHPNLYERDKKTAEKLEKFNFFKKDADFEWELVPLREFSNICVPANIKRPSNFYRVSNDETTAVSLVEGLPNFDIPREWIWMVKDYIWEFVPTNKEDIYHIKLVADDKPDMYLNYNKNKNQVTTGGKQEWKFIDKQPKYLQHVDTGLYLDVQDDLISMSNKMIELAICPLK